MKMASDKISEDTISDYLAFLNEIDKRSQSKKNELQLRSEFENDTPEQEHRPQFAITMVFTVDS